MNKNNLSRFVITENLNHNFNIKRANHHISSPYPTHYEKRECSNNINFIALLTEIDILPYYYFKIQNHIFVYFLREKVENHINQHKLIELLNPTHVSF